MDDIELRKSFLRFYLSLIIIIIITFGLSIACILYGFNKLSQPIGQIKDYLLIPFGLFFKIFGLFSIRVFFINLTRLKIEHNQLIYKKQIISKDEIDNITFRESIILWGGYKTIGTIVRLKNGEKIKIFEVFYYNSHIFDKFIYDNFLNNKKNSTFFKVYKTNSDNIGSSDYLSLKGNLFFSYRSIFLIWVPLFFFTILFLNAPSDPLPLGYNIVLSILIIGYFLLQFYYLFTVKLSSTDLIVKHYFFPYEKRFLITDINEIHFIYRPKQPNQLKITTKDFKTHSFFMGTLREKKEWILLKNYLEAKQIKVTNWEVIT